jgi:D-glycero-D-manno-heptose 1,7-bisphosphate phosphatase
MAKFIFFDLDGTLRQTKSGATFINDPADQQVIAGTQKALNYYASKGFICIGITNQGGVAAGHKSLADAEREQEITLNLFPELLCIYFCPDFDGNDCWLKSRENPAFPIHNSWAKQFLGEFRKPGAGMIKAAILNHHGDTMPNSCWMIGDRPEDEACALAAGIKFIWASVMHAKFAGSGMREIECQHIDPNVLAEFLSL